MAVRNPPSYLQAITDPAAGYTAEQDRLSLGSIWTPGTAALSGRSGILVGPAGGIGEVTIVSNTTIRTNPFRATLQGTRAGTQGQYTVVNDAAVDRTIGAMAAGVQRRDLLVVLVRDSGYAPDTADNGDVVVVPGTPHATTPVEPTLGGANLGNYLILGTINVPATGGTVTFTPRTGLLTVAAGGIRPAPATETAAGNYVGLYRDRSGYLEQWDGSAWGRIVGGGDLTNVSTDVNGIYVVTHNLGRTPRWVVISIRNQPTEGLNQVIKLNLWLWTATTFQVRTYRHDGTNGLASAFQTATSFSWVAGV